MIKDSEIKISSDIKWFGSETERKNFKLSISKRVFDETETFLESDITKESGGVLTGTVNLENGLQTVIIKGIIKAKHTDSSLSRLTFTHKTWEDINNELEINHPGRIIIGWFHSHPGHGVFMSENDSFIQKNFFNEKYMVSFVYDPVKKERGFFRMDDGKINEIKSFGIFENKRNLKEPVELSFNERDPLKEKKIILKNILLYTLITAVLLLCFLIYRINIRIDELKSEIEEQKIIYDNLQKEVRDLKNIFKNSGNTGINRSEKVLRYILKPGDDLKKLAIRFYDNPTMYDTIMKHNNLKNEYDVEPGKLIEIPF